jgi:hypothetical protein
MGMMNVEQVMNEAAPRVEAEERLYCYVHPTVETGLACTGCSQPMCVHCMHQSLVGQLCTRCARQRRPAQYQLTTRHMIIGGGTALCCGFGQALLGMAIILLLPLYSLLLVLLLAVPATGLNVRLLDRVSGGRRGKRFQILVGGAIAVGALPLIAVGLLLWPFDASLTALFIGVVVYRTMLSLR